jgi:redox-sensitive bicupin YhaK (pirin superfamily)
LKALKQTTRALNNIKNMNIKVRKSSERGHADHGWLNSYHTFSFANYYDPNYTEFGCLRVLNEDRITPGSGFPTHSHREYNIFSYVVDGSLTHKDTLKNSETIHAGNVQFTCAGTGLSHSEYNDSKKDDCHFLQIWAKPRKSGLPPCYASTEFTREDKIGKLCEMISPEKKDGTIYIESDLTMYASILGKDQKVVHKVEKGHKVYIHLINKKGYHIVVNKTELKQGDGAFITVGDEETLEIQGLGQESEFVLFDVFGK